MKKLFLIFPVLMAIVLFGSCGKKATFIDSDQTEVTFDIDGGEIEVPFSSDGSFDVADIPEWLTVDVGDNVFTFKTEANESGALRSADVKFVGGENVELIVKVKQADKCTYITASPNEITIPKEGGTKEIKLDTDGANISVEPTNGITATCKNSTIEVSAPANGGGTIKGSLKISCDAVETVVKVTVEGSICPTCKGTGKVKCKKCGGKGWIDLGGEDYMGCTTCGGHGVRREPSDGPVPKLGSGKMNCPTCGGTGH